MSYGRPYSINENGELEASYYRECKKCNDECWPKEYPCEYIGK